MEDITKMDRPSWDQYFACIAEDAAMRSTCTRHRFGAVVVDDRYQIVSTGFNGVVHGAPHCLDIGCIKDEQGIESGMGHGICHGVHAEANALLQAGRRARGSTLYVNGIPCKICARMAVNAGIIRVVAWGDYPDKEGVEILRSAGVEVVV